MGSFRQRWRRVAAAVKDRRSVLLARMRPRGAWQWHHREMEAAVIRATSHDERWVDYRSSRRVFRWARTSPSLRTRCWAVALKALMLVHGMLLRSGVSPRAARVGRVPFELADFRERSAPRGKSTAFSAFVRAYFRFLDYRSLLSADEDIAGDGDTDHGVARLDRITKLQYLLELLLQIRPYCDGTELPLVLEAMDCGLIKILQVYGEICTGVALFLIGVHAPTRPRQTKSTG
uniref:AP180 N-terminal homology (ANTH) domain-containing protein n=1 Tax=Oryza punctata TaxID=4537 RepID=A0A0E0M1W2_ORYPU